MSNHIYCEYPLRTIVELPPGLDPNRLELKLPDPMVQAIREVLSTEAEVIYNLEANSWAIYFEGAHVVTMADDVARDKAAVEKWLRDRVNAQIDAGKRKTPAGWVRDVSAP